MQRKPSKQKPCKVCGELFTPFQFAQSVCTNNSYECARVYGKQQREQKAKKEFNRETKRLKEKIKTKTQYADEAQRAVNRFIRARDYNDPCISCGTTRRDIQYAAGHLLSRGAHPELRFNEDNIHRQCNKRCNLELSGNIGPYRENLIKKIGSAKMAILEGPHEPNNYDIDDLLIIKHCYTRRAKELEGERLD